MPLTSSLCSLPALCSCGTPGTLAAVAESDGGEAAFEYKRLDTPVHLPLTIAAADVHDLLHRDSPYRQQDYEYKLKGFVHHFPNAAQPNSPCSVSLILSNGSLPLPPISVSSKDSSYHLNDSVGLCPLSKSLSIFSFQQSNSTLRCSKASILLPGPL